MRSLLIAGLAAAQLLLVTSSWAAPSPSELAAARRLFRDGVADAKAGRWDAARNAFERAYGITNKPEILLNVAGARAKTGRLVGALEAYLRFLREAPEAVRERHRRQVGEVVNDLERRVARLTITAEGLVREDEVTMDDRALARASLDVELPVDPGAHTLRVMRGAEVVDELEIQLAEGERRDAELRAPSPSPRFEPPPPPPPPPLVQNVAELPPDMSPDEGGGAIWWWVGAAVVAVGAGVALAVSLPRDPPDPYGGSTGVVVRALERGW